MSSTHYLLTEEQLWCCICLEVFTDPITLPCGHNFCKGCITRHLNFCDRRRCPLCKEPLNRSYKLGVNTFISEMAAQFRRSTGRKASISVELSDVTPEKASRHVPTGPKRTKTMSCLLLALGLMCLSLYFAICQNLHQSLSGLKTHLSATVEEVADGMCSRHDKPLELYCKNKHVPICRFCVDSSHQFHQVVSLKEQHELMRTELEKLESDLRLMIQQREQKIQEVRHSVRLSKEAAAREKERGILVFSSLMQSMETAQDDLLQIIEQKQKAMVKQANAFIEDLELEISELRRRHTKVEQLTRPKNPFHALQNLAPLDDGPPSKDLAEFSFCPPLYEGHTRTALVRTVKQLAETVATEMKNQQEAELERAQQNAVDVTLDPDTAHPALILSEDGKRVHCCDVSKSPPDTSTRFTRAMNVLGKQSFSCGQFHYEVGVKGKTAWTIGVAQHSVNRKEKSPIKPENGYWTLRLRDRTMYFALDSQPVAIAVDHSPEKVEVFVDYDEGLVSFYDVDAAALLYSFTGCCFTERLYPFFSPGTSDGGRNAAPLIISLVNQKSFN